jgi:hypothetical protein
MYVRPTASPGDRPRLRVFELAVVRAFSSRLEGIPDFSGGGVAAQPDWSVGRRAPMAYWRNPP